MSSLLHLPSPSGLSFLQRLQSEKIADPDLDLTRAEEIFHKTHSSASHPESNGCCYLTITWQALQEDVHRWEEIRNRAQDIYRLSAGHIRPPAKLLGSKDQISEEMIDYRISQARERNRDAMPRKDLFDPLDKFEEQLLPSQGEYDTEKALEDRIFNASLGNAMRKILGIVAERNSSSSTKPK